MNYRFHVHTYQRQKNNITDVIDDVLSSHIQILLIDNSQYVKPCDLC